METKLAMAREWAVKAQGSLSKLKESQDLLHMESKELRGLRDFDTHQLRMLEEECSALSAIVEDRGTLLSTARIREEEALADLGVAYKRIAT